MKHFGFDHRPGEMTPADARTHICALLQIELPVNTSASAQALGAVERFLWEWANKDCTQQLDAVTEALAPFVWELIRGPEQPEISQKEFEHLASMLGYGDKELGAEIARIALLRVGLFERNCGTSGRVVWSSGHRAFTSYRALPVIFHDRKWDGTYFRWVTDGAE